MYSRGARTRLRDQESSRHRHIWGPRSWQARSQSTYPLARPGAIVIHFHGCACMYVCMYVCFCPAAVCREAHLKHLPRWMATSAAAVRVAVGKNKTKNKGFSHLHPHRRSRERDWVWFWFVLHIPNVVKKKRPPFPRMLCYVGIYPAVSQCATHICIYIYIYLHPSASSGIETPVEREGGDGRRSGDETRKVGGSM